MTANGTTFLGYDKDGDQVFRLPNGNVLGGSDLTEEDADQDYRHGAGGLLLREYEESWGPITKEAP
jgi:hypothetical protein